MSCAVVIFSKDRALQLDATLRSFLLHCKDARSAVLRVLYTASTGGHAAQYERLAKDYGRYPFLKLVEEKDFRSDLLALAAPYDYLLFLVDDNIFLRSFRLSDVIDCLERNPDALGFSLRLGENTTYCYPLDQKQRVPVFLPAGRGILKHDWTEAELDFGYPLEVSSSIYRIDDMLTFLAMLPFRNPNTLEAMMDFNRTVFRAERPALLCYKRSVTFCAPLNMVQTAWSNRACARAEYSPDSLARLFGAGYRVDIAAYKGIVPSACHQEVELKLLPPSGKRAKKGPKVSVIIPCYNYAEYLPEAVESVSAQTFPDWECIIVNDGSPDNTREVAAELISRYPGKRIKYLEKQNGGPADARNFGIRNSSGDYILPLDADDRLHPEMLMKAASVLNARPEISIVYTHLMEFHSETGESRRIEYRDYEPEEILRYDCYAYCSMYRRSVWEETGGYNKEMPGYEDWDFWVGSFGKGFYAARIPEPLVFYRSKESGLFAEAARHDSELKARIVLNHAGLFSDVQVRWAQGVIDDEPWALAVESVRGTIPDLEDLRHPEMPLEIMSFIKQADMYVGRGDMESARGSIKQALHTCPANEQVLRILCGILSRLGDAETAADFLKARGID